MNSYQCPKCGHISYIFGHDGARKVANEMKIDTIGEIAMTNVIIKCCYQSHHYQFIVSSTNLTTSFTHSAINTLIGDIPLTLRIRETSDNGTPITVSHPDGEEVSFINIINN